jgi:hypothetical protein
VPHLTFDNWTSLGNKNYIAVCAHYINQDFKLVDRCIELNTYTASHSAEDMKRTIKDILQKHGINDGSATVLGNESGPKGYESGNDISDESDVEEMLNDVEVVVDAIGDAAEASSMAAEVEEDEDLVPVMT